jgi:tRNA-splicing endonuclease subunit Sen54
MHDALAYTRVHAPKYELDGTFDAASGLSEMSGQKGQHFRTMGKTDGQGTLHLLPEEALYLVERGNLNLKWSAVEGEATDALPFTLQSAYATLIGRLGLSIERYIVFAGLKRSGYVVHRSLEWYPEDQLNRCHTESHSASGTHSVGRAFYDLFRSGNRRANSSLAGPLVAPGLYRNYCMSRSITVIKLLLTKFKAEIYFHLSMVPFHDPKAATEQKLTKESFGRDRSKNSLRCSFHVWKPRPDFRKSAPGPPDFRIAVLDAREDGLPSLQLLQDLLESVPYEPPPGRMEHQIFQKLKHGYRNVILAVVDEGVVSYIRLADAAFGREKLYSRGVRGLGGKRGGMRGGRGRGRGKG